jgi:uncharacterized phage protein gp47/JayE
MSGLTTTGFVPKTIEEIKAEIAAEMLATVDAALDLSADQSMGQAVGIFAQREAKLWELLAVAYGGADPRDAEDFLLDGVCAITGTTRRPATKSLVTPDCVVTAGFAALAGAMQANVSGQPTKIFRNKAAVGPLAAGTHAIEFEALDYGPTVANAGTLTVITAPVSGWTSVTNPLDATLGELAETDASLAARREQELAAAGACTGDALRADLLQLKSPAGALVVQQAYVFQNTTMFVDAAGLPAKSFEAVIFDGLTPLATNAQVAAAIFQSKPSGMESYGTTSVSVTDSTGEPNIVKFSRATIKNVWLEFDLVVDANRFPLTGATLVKEAVVAAGLSSLNLGIDVISAKMKAAALTVQGVIDAPTLRLGFAASPVGTANLVITGRQIASLDTARITVATTTGTP